MSAADVAYVVAWEAQTGITLNMAFNGVGACTAPTAAAESNAKCTGSITENGTTYTMPGQVVDSTSPNDQGLINALLADQKDFNWTTHTWSHEFLGCVIWQQQPFTSATAATGGTLAAEPTTTRSRPHRVRRVRAVSRQGSDALHYPLGDLDVPDATNGTGRPAPVRSCGKKRPTTPVARASGLQHLPQDFDRCNLRVHRPRRGGPDRATANYTFTDTVR